MNPIFARLPVSVFEVMSALAREHEAVNLGQGFPDDPGPEDVRRKAAEAVIAGWNQYPPMLGIPELRHAIAAHYRHWQGLVFDPEREVMVTSGATEALAGALMALIEPGDEVVLFQPLYDAYLPLVLRAGGVPRLVRLEPPHWRFDEELLTRAFSHKTKVVLFNNPLNPSGTVYAADDLTLLARFCMQFDAIAVCDEGPSFPPTFDPATSGGLGLKIVSSLAGAAGAEAIAVDRSVPFGRIVVRMAL